MSQEKLTKQQNDIFRVRKTINKMLNNRGYLVSQQELNLTTETFSQKFNLHAQTRDQFTILVQVTTCRVKSPCFRSSMMISLNCILMFSIHVLLQVILDI